VPCVAVLVTRDDDSDFFWCHDHPVANIPRECQDLAALVLPSATQFRCGVPTFIPAVRGRSAALREPRGDMKARDDRASAPFGRQPKGRGQAVPDTATIDPTRTAREIPI
jgi:hypothetical protein